MKLQTFLLYILAVALAMFTGFVDMHNDEVQAALLVILVGSATLAFIEPRAAWRWALILGLSIPVTYLIVPLVDYTTPFQMDSYWGTFLAFVPAFIGAYGGVFLRWLISRRQK
jgi:hypothetical protein